MNETKLKYERPEMKRVRFEDKNLVAFNNCFKSDWPLNQQGSSCCNYQDVDFGRTANSTPDLS